MTSPPSVALAIPTIERPMAVQRLVRSARRYLPDVQIYVGDQSRPDPFMDEFYRANDVHLIRLPYDCGVAEARNRIVEQIEEKYFLLCDDDFVLKETTTIADALAILEAAPDIGVVGGKLADAFTGGAETRYADRLYEMWFMLDRANRLLVSFPLHLFAPQPRVVAGLVCYPCDALLNFAVFRRSVFSEKIRWDPEFKSDGEHEDFYLNLKVNSDWTAVYLPTMTAEHERPETTGYQRKRQRTGGWSGMMRKWGIDQYLEFGAGLRTVVDIGAFYYERELSRARFLEAGHLSYDARGPAEDGAFEVGAGGRIRPLRGYDPLTGRYLAEPRAITQPMDAGLGTLLSGTDPTPAQARDATDASGVVPALLVVTIDRPQVVQRLVRTARARFPRIRILVADQTPRTPLMDAFYRDNAVEVEYMPYDAGVCASRNALLPRLADDECLVVCDDDFVFTPETDFEPAMTILEHRPDIGVVGGLVRNIDAAGEPANMLDWAMMIEVDQRAGLLAFVPAHELAPVIEVAGGVPFYRCDAVVNFSVIRRSIFNETIRWDPAFRSDGEHEDFYINLKLNGPVGVAHLPSMVCEHHRPVTSSYERKRLRLDGWRRLMSKWKVQQYLEVNTGLRTLRDMEAIRPYRTLHRSTFYHGGALRHGLREASVAEGAFDVGYKEIHPLNIYSAIGEMRFDREVRISEFTMSGGAMRIAATTP